MKKKLLYLLIFPATVASFHAQTPALYVGKGGTFVVGNGIFVLGDEYLDKGLVYVKGGVSVGDAGSAGATTNGIVRVNGNMAIYGTTSDEFKVNATDGEFNLHHTEVSKVTRNYGQLYITGITQTNITGKVRKEYIAEYNHNLNKGFQQMAIPFHEFSFKDLSGLFTNVDITTGDGANGRGRTVNSVYRWNNKMARTDKVYNASAVSTTSIGNPTEYYMIPTVNASNNRVWNPLADTKVFEGYPVSDTSGDTEFSLSGGPAFSFNKGAAPAGNGARRNIHNEPYNSYIDDAFVADRSVDWDVSGYGKRLYQMGNPFLTNLDLAWIHMDEGTGDDENTITNIQGLYKYGENSLDYTSSIGSISGANVMAVTYPFGAGIAGAGDVEKTMIGPMETFIIKMRNDTAATLKFNKTRSFSKINRIPGVPTTPVPMSLSASGGTNRANASGRIVLRQLAVVLKNDNGIELGRTYYALTDNAINGKPKLGEEPFQSHILTDTKDAKNIKYPIFTREEKPTGGKDENVDSRLYINEANALSFAGKEIPLEINDKINEGTLHFYVYENAVKLKDGANLSDGKSFYISKGNKIVKVKSGDTMPLTTNTYGLYYDKPAGLEDEVAGNTGTKVVRMKNTKDYAVIFDKTWKSASVEVFSVAGQLVHAKKDVPTTSNYILPINLTNAMYIVKIVSNDGEVVTKKIIK